MESIFIIQASKFIELMLRFTFNSWKFVIAVDRTSTKWFVSGDYVCKPANNWTYDQQITALNNIWNTK